MGDDLTHSVPGKISSPSLAAIMVGILAIVLFFNDLGETSLPSYDDAYHAQTAKEMLNRLDPIGISYGGHFSFESSPLPNWLIAISYLIFGVNEYAARFPSALLALLGIVIVYFFSRKRWGESAAVAAGFILLTSMLYLRYGRDVMAEIPLTFFTALALLAFISAQEKERKYLWFGLFTGLAVLSKSALGIIPLIIAGIYLIAKGRARKLFNKYFIGAVAITLLTVSIWYIPALLSYGQRFIDSHIGAYLANHTFTGHHASMGIWGLFYYILWLPVQYLPWILLLLPSLYWTIREWKKDNTGPALLLAILVPIVLLSLITSKYTRYLMPIFPASSILIVSTWSKKIPERLQKKITAVIGGIAAIAVIVIIVFPLSFGSDRNADIKKVAATISSLEKYSFLVNYKLDHYRIQNPMLFYSDRVFTHEMSKIDSVEGLVGRSGASLVLTKSENTVELQSLTRKGFAVQQEIAAGELVLFKIYLPGNVKITNEHNKLAKKILALETSRYIGNYKISSRDLRNHFRKRHDLRLIAAKFTPELLFNSMEFRNSTTGLTLRSALPELMAVNGIRYNIIELQTVGDFVLFQIEKREEPFPGKRK